MFSSPVADALLSSIPSAGRLYTGLSVRAGAWIVMPRSRPRDGLAIYNPQRLRGKLAKALIQCGLWIPPSVRLQDQALGELEATLGDAAGEKPVSCVFYFRAPGLFVKTIALVLNQAGHAVAYAKIASTAEGRRALAREGDVLDRLAQVPDLRDRVPRVIARTMWRDFPVLVLSVGPSRRLPKGFGNAHRDFLHRLNLATASRAPLFGTAMWKTMTERFAAAESSLDHAWRERYGWALRQIEQETGADAIPLCLAHRDFVPWNIHSDGNGGLFVFDWELARDECTPAWDFFHFHLAGQAMRSGRMDPGALGELVALSERDGIKNARNFLLAYLADIGLFLHDRLLRSPARQPNRFLDVVRDTMDALRQRSVL